MLCIVSAVLVAVLSYIAGVLTVVVVMGKEGDIKGVRDKRSDGAEQDLLKVRLYGKSGTGTTTAYTWREGDEQ